jgi:hypothetical protein
LWVEKLHKETQRFDKIKAQNKVDQLAITLTDGSSSS